MSGPAAVWSVVALVVTSSLRRSRCPAPAKQVGPASRSLVRGDLPRSPRVAC
uniref:Uncharacterized protein n=1 Tax=Setaria italica TaxID=4555 RepID=K3ZGR3_SETIT